MAYPKFKSKIEWNEFFDELRANGISVIDDLFQVELMKSIILSRIAKTFNITSLTFREDGEVLVSLLSVAPHRQYKDLHIQEVANVLTTEGWARPVQYYCDELLNVEVEGPVSLHNLDHVIYKIGTGKDTKFVQRSGDTGFINILTGEEYPEFSTQGGPGIWDKKSGMLMPNVIAYNEKRFGTHTCTNGQLKKRNITLMATSKKDFSATKSWRKATYNAVDFLCDGSEVTPKDIAQANARLSAFKAPSCPIAPVKTFSVYMGKITFDMEKGGDEYRDGWGFLASEYLGEAFTNLAPDKYFFAPWATDGLGVQCRPWTCKIMAETASRAYISEFKRHLYRKFGIEEVVLQRGSISIEDREEYIIGIKSKGKNGKFAGKIVTISDYPFKPAQTDLLTDLNGLKAPYDPDLESNLEILQLTHEEHDVEHGSKTSSQLIQSLMIANPAKTMECLRELAKEYIESQRNSLLTDVGTPPRWLDFQGNINYQEVIGRVVPHFAHKVYAPLWHSQVDHAVKGYVKRVRRLNMPTRGAHTYLTPDPAADFGVRILGINNQKEVEVFCPIGEKHGYNRVIAVKYPKQGFAEFLKGRIIGISEYCRRVQECEELTDLQKRLICKHVNNISKGTLVIPAIETLKNLCAGLDFDGDATSLFFDKRIIDIMWDLEPKAVIIREDDVTKHEVLSDVLGV